MSRRTWRVALGFALLVQLVVLYAPRAPSTGGVPFLDKLIHFAVFGAVAFTALKAGFDARWVVLLLVLHAGLSEVLQATVLPHRDGDWHDALADCVGVGVGAAVGAGAGSWRR